MFEINHLDQVLTILRLNQVVAGSHHVVRQFVCHVSQAIKRQPISKSDDSLIGSLLHIIPTDYRSLTP